MNAPWIDTIARSLSRRRRLRHIAAQDVTPAADLATAPISIPALLFVQTFQAGAITPKEGTEGRYTLTLEAGTGQTVYFSDRPDRIVGAAPTQHVLDRIGFPADSPPNAALVVETAPGDTDVAVVELFSPVYDEATGGVTYEIEVLQNWEAELDLAFGEAPKDLAVVEPTFGAAHLFIDGAVGNLDFDGGCMRWAGGDPIVACMRPGYNNPGQFNDVDYCWANGKCVPCEPASGEPSAITRYWADKCNQTFAGCGGECQPYNRCPRGLMKYECWQGAG